MEVPNSDGMVDGAVQSILDTMVIVNNELKYNDIPIQQINIPLSESLAEVFEFATLKISPEIWDKKKHLMFLDSDVALSLKPEYTEKFINLESRLYLLDMLTEKGITNKQIVAHIFESEIEKVSDLDAKANSKYPVEVDEDDVFGAGMSFVNESLSQHEGSLYIFLGEPQEDFLADSHDVWDVRVGGDDGEIEISQAYRFFTAKDETSEKAASDLLKESLAETTNALEVITKWLLSII